MPPPAIPPSDLFGLPPFPPAEEEELPEGETHAAILIGDEQIHRDVFQGVFNSAAAKIRAPSRRLPAANLGVTQGMEALLLHSIPAEDHKVLQGMISMGDVTDTASTEELKVYLDTLEEIAGADPILTQLLFPITGNHEVLHFGVASSGWALFGALGLIVRKQGAKSYKKDMHLPQAGGRDKVLNKEVLIKTYYKRLYGKEPNPAVLESSDYHDYVLKDRKKQQWNDTGQVFKDFWRQEKDGSWNALVFNEEVKNEERPEKRWFQASARKLNDLETQKGKIPVYVIALDTLDYLEDGMETGNIEGHVSYMQVGIVQAFMEAVRSSEPNAKFILGGHYPAHQIAKIKKSGLYRILEDEDIVAYVGAHTHGRGYQDLTQRTFKDGLLALGGEFQLERQTPLPEVVVPAVIDYPNEMMIFRYGVEDQDPDKLFFEFEFAGIDPETLPGNSEEVCEELKKLRPLILTHDDAILEIQDDQIREFGTPGTSLLRQADLALNLDTSLTTRFDRIHDEIIKEDVIPAHVIDKQYEFREFMSIMKLSLMDAGLESEALEIEPVYLATLDLLNENYKRIRRGEFLDFSGDHDLIDGLDQAMKDFNQEVYALEEKVNAELQSDTSTPEQKEHLEVLSHLLPLTSGFMEDYRHWLEEYEKKLQTERKPRDFIYDANLSGSAHYVGILEHLQEIPVGSRPWALMVHGWHEADQYEGEFYGGEETLRKKVPDKIRLELSADTGAAEVTLSPLTEEDQKIKRRHWCEESTPNYAEEGREATQAALVPSGDRGFEWHWSYPTGLAWHDAKTPWNGSQRLLSGQIGGRMHLLNRYDKPRVNLNLHLGGATDFEGYWEVSAKAAVTGGDPWGLAEIGPMLEGGLVLAGKEEGNRYLGLGGNLTLAEGVLSAEVSHHWNSEIEDEQRVLVTTDLFSDLRLLHWTGIADWVDRDF